MENYNNPFIILLISKEPKQWTINVVPNITYTITQQTNIISIVSKNF